MIRIRRIDTRHPLYAQEVDLRTRVLLRPIGLTMDDYLTLAPGREERSEHFVAVFDHPQGERVLGTATLLCPDGDAEERSGKVSQVCVDPQRQNEGIGQKLMVAIEARAFGELGLPGLYCHAQLVAIPFYEKIGWRVNSEVFLEAGIKHKRMAIAAPAETDIADPELEFELE
ncbi:MAG: GNAT family N-acetyltransferase [Phycisphaerales bacterium]|nr:GNAT family N-acetyltransferase [Planctomycetota bacterium]MCH8508559.1 GNAT family N-acetyltransferase [Phycisphaerales bacterium]